MANSPELEKTVQAVQDFYQALKNRRVSQSPNLGGRTHSATVQRVALLRKLRSPDSSTRSPNSGRER